jgi:DNA-binding transcriptional LysR family regulator
VLATVAAGRAVSLGDAQLPRYYSRPDLAYVAVPDLPAIEFGLAWRTRDDADARIRAFVEAMTTADPEGPA